MRNSESLTVKEVLILMSKHPGLDAIDDERQRGGLIADYLRWAESIDGECAYIGMGISAVKAAAIRAGMSRDRDDFIKLLTAVVRLQRHLQRLAAIKEGLSLVEELGLCSPKSIGRELGRLALLTDNTLMLHPMGASG